MLLEIYCLIRKVIKITLNNKSHQNYSPKRNSGSFFDSSAKGPHITYAMKDLNIYSCGISSLSSSMLIIVFFHQS